MSNIRMLPPADGNHDTIVINGRTYTGSPSSPVDMPDFDAHVAGANGWLALFGMACPVGATSARPTARADGCVLDRGQRFYDTTLSKVVIYDGAGAWRDATGASV